MKRIVKSMLFPPIIAVILIVISAIPITICSLSIPQIPAPIQYAAYLFSAYALSILILNFKRVIKWVSNLWRGSRIYKLLYSNKITRMFLQDFSFRGKVSLYQGLAINTLYALFQTVSAIYNGSSWFGAVAVYYFIMGLIRMILIRGVKKASVLHDKERILSEYKSYRLCGAIMFALNIGMVGMAIQMVRHNVYKEYPGVFIYASAAYTFYIMTLSIINLVKARKQKSPILSASKALNFTAALMSIFVLQTAMIPQFGGDEQFRQIANSLTGGAVCFITFAVAVYMIIKSFVKIQKLTKL